MDRGASRFIHLGGNLCNLPYHALRCKDPGQDHFIGVPVWQALASSRRTRLLLELGWFPPRDRPVALLALPVRTSLPGEQREQYTATGAHAKSGTRPARARRGTADPPQLRAAPASMAVTPR